ncbi:MAG: GlcNAc-transferase family protein [Bacteroidota bacterium]
MAYLTNRTLILPSAYHMYLLKGKSDFSTFFDLSEPGIKLLSLSEFCALKNIEPIEEAVKAMSRVVDFDTIGTVINFEQVPVPEAFSKERPVLHIEDIFEGEEIVYLNKNLLGSFEQIFYTSRQTALKQLIAKYVVYRTDLFDLAWRFVNYIGDQTYYAMHVRRNDFQYKDLFIACTEILRHLLGVVPEGARLYIATDHPDKTFFDPLKEVYEVIFYDDIATQLELESFDVNWIPIIEQFICTRGIKFAGMKLSTLSSYIFRMRGYMDDIEDKQYYINGEPFNEEEQCSFLEERKYTSSWCREYKSIWNFELPSIFVSIASYADQQLLPTLRNLLSKAAHPERVYLGVHLQDTTTAHEHLLAQHIPNLRIVFTPKEESKGVVWARNEIKRKLYQEEDYFLQIDAHSRFKQNWDNLLINQHESLDVAKAILTTYPNAYKISDQEEDYLKLNRNSPLRIRRFLTDDPRDNRLKIENAAPLKKGQVLANKWCAAGFLFTKGEWVKEVVLPDNIRFNGEEDLLTFLSFLKAYDLRITSEATVWHNYDFKDDKTGQRYKEYNENEIEDNSIEIVNDALYQQFYIRSLEELEYYLGITFRNPSSRVPAIPEEFKQAKAWRLFATTTSSRFAWDVKQLKFLTDNEQLQGNPIASGSAFQGDHSIYAVQNAFTDNSNSHWGGRSDEAHNFWIGLELDSPSPVERIFLKQGRGHWVDKVDIQIQLDGEDWKTIREVNNLRPGINEVPLFKKPAAENVQVVAAAQQHPKKETPTRRVRFLSAHPDKPYYVWQTQVYLSNFKAMGISMRDCIALFSTKPRGYASPELRQLCVQFPAADIRMYYDNRNSEGRAYAPSIQPHLISKAFKDTPEWKADFIFYHDCDIAFLRKPNFQKMFQAQPDACFLSDTDGYIGYDYLHKCCENIRKERPDLPEDDLIHRMCAIVGIDVEVVKTQKGGGAQYLLQGVAEAYWDKVYKDSIAISQLFERYMRSLQLEKEPKEYIQVWTAGMWAYLWNLWLLEKETVLHPELKFLFAGGVMDDTATVMHMAGLEQVVKHYHFDKLDWVEMNPVKALSQQPYLFDHFPKGTVARAYADWIHQAANVPIRPLLEIAPSKKWRLLVWKTTSGLDRWEVEHLKVTLPDGVEITKWFDAGNENGQSTLSTILQPDATYWEGTPMNEAHTVPHFFIGFELDKPAIPNKIQITQHGEAHIAKVVSLQLEDEEGQWRTTTVTTLEAKREGQFVLYHSDGAHQGTKWRVLTRKTSKKFAWDVKRLKFMFNSNEVEGAPISSGYALSDKTKEYAPRNAFNEHNRHWGGRADHENCFWIGIATDVATSINRIILKQGATHFTDHIEIQKLDRQNSWETIYRANDLQNGLNDIVIE